MEQTLNKHMELLKNCKFKKGCIREPAVQFDEENYIPDMLHMKKGIISKLVNQLVEWTIVQHKEDALMMEMKWHKIPFV